MSAAKLALSFGAAFVLLAPSVGRAAPGAPGAAMLRHRHVFPDLFAGRGERLAGWSAVDGGRLSPMEAPSGGGSRVAALVSAADADEVVLEARWVGADGRARSAPMERTFAQAEQRVFVLDLGETVDSVALWLSAADDLRVDSIRWELLEPAFPEAGRRSREAGPRPTPPPLDSGLEGIGVVTRSSWGARATTCTGAEDDWYRMAIHHTAGTQTSGGTVAGAVAAVQAYAMDSGSYCDIPYQFMVGYDGTLYEGRELAYTSGATGGGQNDGNAAMCFVGCYHPTDCPGGSHSATDAMMVAGRTLIQTMSALHDIPIDTDHIKGHRDWPGNSTACPGEHVVDRFAELLVSPDLYAGAVVGASFDPSGATPLEVSVGERIDLTVDVENTGNTTWRAGETFLATLPRDVEGPLSHPSWPSPTRIAAPPADVPPGAVGRFTFTIEPARLGRAEQSLAIVQEWVTWFADAPWGGGPAEGSLLLVIDVVEASMVDSGGLDDGASTLPEADSAEPVADADPTEGGSGWAELGGRPGASVDPSKLGGCAQRSGAPLGLGGLVASLAVLFGARPRPSRLG